MALGRKRDDEAIAGASASQGARWQSLESAFTKVVMTLGIIGIGTAIGAIMGTQDVDAWIVGLVVSVVSVILAALLWSRYRE